MALITEGQLFTSFPANAYMVFSYLKSQLRARAAKSTENNPVEEEATPAEQFYLKHVDDKGDHLMVDDELNIIDSIDWQMARVVPAGEAFGPSLVTADMGSSIYNGRSSLTDHDVALAHFLKAKGATGLADMMSGNERARRFFFGLDVDLPWEETLLVPLIRGIWTAFGVDKDTDWRRWKGNMLGEQSHDKRLGHILDRFGAGP